MSVPKQKTMKRQVIAGATLLAFAGLSTLAGAQEFSDVKPSKGALTLKAQGSFFIGGNTHQVGGPGTAAPYGGTSPGQSMINQMYVQYQLPEKDNNLPPIVFVHGCCLSSKTWETTPDGRMGWYEYFTRQGFDTYMADQVGRARSGFDALQYQKIRYDAATPPFTAVDGSDGVGCINNAPNPVPSSAGCLVPDGFPNGTNSPSVLIATDMFAWNVFRYGPPCIQPVCGAFGTALTPTGYTGSPTIAPWGSNGNPGAELFPMETVGLYSTPGRSGGKWRGAGGSGTFFKQVIPDMSASLGTFGANAGDIRPTPQRMSVLANKLGGAILVGHSQSSSFPTKAALLDPTGVRGIIQLETGCFQPPSPNPTNAPVTLTQANVKTLAKIPILIIEGDNYVSQPSPPDGTWTPQARPVQPCPNQIKAIRAAGGDITYIHLPGPGSDPPFKGVGAGNSHMFMQDLNNLKVADVIIDWIKKHVKKGRHDVADNDHDHDHGHH
jgi:pimeloyl-ACP methyl ester carboxylesterase